MMNQNIRRLMPTILSSVAALCSLISFIFVIVFEGDVWDYITSIFTFLGICGLVAVAIIDLVTPDMNKLFYIIPFSGIVLATLLGGLESLTNIGSASSYYRYSYFNIFVGSIITILVIVLFIVSVYKKNTLFTAISLTYLAANLFVSGLYAFNRALFSLFTDDRFKYGFRNFATSSASFLFYAAYAFIAYKYIKDEN